MAQLNSSMMIWLRGSAQTPGKEREGHFLQGKAPIVKVSGKGTNSKGVRCQLSGAGEALPAGTMVSKVYQTICLLTKPRLRSELRVGDHTKERNP